MPVDFRPKNITDHKIFKISWRLKIKIAFSSLQEPLHNLVENGFQDLFSCSPAVMIIPQFFFQTKNKDIPIKRNKIIQTGAKNQFGGKKLGFLSSVNQEVGMAGAVKNEPIIPANWQTTIEATSLAVLFFIYFILPKNRTLGDFCWLAISVWNQNLIRRSFYRFDSADICPVTVTVSVSPTGLPVLSVRTKLRKVETS